MTSNPTLGHGPWGQESWTESRPSRVPMVQIWMLSDEWLVRYTPLENVKLGSNSTNGMESWTNKQTNEWTYKRKDENYIPLSINARGVIKGQISSSSLIPVYTIHPSIDFLRKLWWTFFNVWKLERKKNEEIKGQIRATAWFWYIWYIHPLSMCVPSFNFVGLTVPEKSVTKNLKKKKFTKTHTHRKDKNYIPIIYFVYRGYNNPKTWTVWFYHTAMYQKDADGMANSVDPDQEQSYLGLHCLPRPDCLNTQDHCSQ